jgi:Family of unknown function (DUF5681)
MNEVARDEGGKFLEGVSGNPAGRPAGTRSKLVVLKERLELAVREEMTAAQIGRIISKMAGMAEQGDVKAARLILDKFMSSASVSEESAEDRGNSGITIRIENATFKAQNPIIDADFKEVKKDG